MHYDRKNGYVALSVRELCLLTHRSGSLDTRMPSRVWKARAAEGRDAHAAWQKSQGEGYFAEVALENCCRCDDVTFHVSGRADGVLRTQEGELLVEEIKTVTGAPELYTRFPRGEDLAQLSCYAYFLCAARGLPEVTLRITYIRAGDITETAHADARHADACMSAERLRELYVAMLRMLLPRAKDLIHRETVVQDIAKSAVFPYADMRASQEEMILECWRDMRQGQTLFAQAPTGIGKTIATLYPAVRCLGEDRCDKIFYLTAKGSTRREALGAVKKLADAGTPLRACVIAARESACLCEEAIKACRANGERLKSFCNPDRCPYAKGYYDRVESVIESLLAEGDGLYTSQRLQKKAREGGVCPYELALDVSERCEVIICDYNYVFSPGVRLQRYFADGIPHTQGHRYIFLVDEAHNLPDRARDMYSGGLRLSFLKEVQDSIHDFEEMKAQAVFPEEDYAQRGQVTLTSASLDDVIGAMSRMADRCAGSAVTESDGVRRGVSLEKNLPEALDQAVTVLSQKCDRWLRRNAAHPLFQTVDNLSSLLRCYTTAAAYYDDHYVTFTESEGEDVSVRLICLDPSDIIGPLLRMAESRVLFSATLTPADYFADILGGGRSSVTVSFDSPFPQENLCVAVADRISTRYEDREKPANVRQIVSYIAATASAKKGNYMVYFPSYAYLEKVYTLFKKKYPRVATVLQTPGMTARERDAFIAAFQPDSDRLQIGFCVLGGSFSEGVDLPGKCLIGAVIVGVGIPGLSNERNIIKDYYDAARDGEGYAYAYTYPGMNHVLQAAGRVIRRVEDRGVVVLLDDRYMSAPYLNLYPAHWEHMSAVGDPASLAGLLTKFWG